VVLVDHAVSAGLFPGPVLVKIDRFG
jgi:hypothetical protein